MFKIIPIALSLVLTVGAAVATDNVINNTDAQLDERSETAKDNVDYKDTLELNSSASFSQDGFVEIAR